MTEHCKKNVMHSNMFRTWPCQRPVWKDGFCKQHHPETVRTKRDRRDKLFDIESNVREVDRKLAEIVKACVEWIVEEGVSLHPEAKVLADEIKRLRKQREALVAVAIRMRGEK